MVEVKNVTMHERGRGEMPNKANVSRVTFIVDLVTTLTRESDQQVTSYLYDSQLHLQYAIGYRILFCGRQRQRQSKFWETASLLIANLQQLTVDH